MNEIGIIGLGRFGKVLVNILQKGYRIYGYDIGNIDSVPGVTVCGLEKVLKQKVIFIAVPIRSFKSLIQLIAPKLRNDTTLIDVCSVKTYPVQIMKENLNKNIGIIATHPMFGPDSFQTIDTGRGSGIHERMGKPMSCRDRADNLLRHPDAGIPRS